MIAPLLSDPAAWLALATLVVMEVVLGIDNLVFVAVLSNKLPEEHRRRGRAIGLGLALLLRLMLLGTLAFIVGLTHPVLRVMGHAFSWRDLILLAGGLFLVWKATREIHDSVEPQDGGAEHPERPAIGFASAVIAEGCGVIVPKGYIYAAMAFSAFVEGLNMLARKRRRGVRNGA